MSSKNEAAARFALADAIAGVAGSLISMLAFYPIDVIKTNLQVGSSDQPSTSRTGAFQNDDKDSKLLFQTRGLLQHVQPYVKGLSYKAVYTATSSFVYFFLYSWIRSCHKAFVSTRNDHKNSTAYYLPSTSVRLLLSAAAAMINTLLTLPLDALSTRSQIKPALTNQSKASDMDYATRTDNTDNNDIATVQDFETKKMNLIWDDPTSKIGDATERSESNMNATPLELWRGLWPALLLCIHPAIHFTVFDSIKSCVLRYRIKSRNYSHNGAKKQIHRQRLNMLDAFLIGIIAKFVATILTYPLIRVKTILMVSKKRKVANETFAQRVGNNACDGTVSSMSLRQNTTMREVLRDIISSDGYAGLYRGCGLQLLHTVLKSALLMMVREFATVTTHRILTK